MNKLPGAIRARYPAWAWALFDSRAANGSDHFINFSRSVFVNKKNLCIRA
jgi:hypothetical protein